MNWRELEFEVQEMYDTTETAIKETETKYGKEKEKKSTDDKLIERTKEPQLQEGKN